MADEVIAFAIKTKIAPITVCIVDSEANVIVQKRMDYCSHVGPSDFALAKACTCIALKTSSRSFRDKYTDFNEQC
jgi:uncharacterized protein GlcG (DUF336 family)